MKRFYKQVSVYNTEDGYGVKLDERPVKTPAMNVLLCQDEKLATFLMDEWEEQDKEVLPDTMPVNQIVITALDKFEDRFSIEKHILSYIDTDLLCYRSDTSPYKEQQEEKWGKWTDWFEKKFKVTLEKTMEINALEQPLAVFNAVKSYIGALDPLELTLFESLVEDTSSPVLTLALFEKAATAQALYEAVLVDDLVRAELYDEEKYGVAPDQEKKRKSIRRNLDAAEKVISTFAAKE